jgi:hypothetical protein
MRVASRDMARPSSDFEPLLREAGYERSEVSAEVQRIATNPVLSEAHGPLPQQSENWVYLVGPGIGHADASASIPLVGVDRSSPWWQGRLVAPTPVSQPARSSAIRTKRIIRRLFGRREPAAAQVGRGVRKLLEVNIGTGVAGAMLSGGLSNADLGAAAKWILGLPSYPHPTPALDDDAWLRPDTAEAISRAPRPDEPEWNEAADDLPAWISMEDAEYQRGALMGRRRRRRP